MKDHAVNPIIRDFVRNQTDIQIDRYSDKGGFGELYFGKRNILNDRVALKFYELDPSGNGHEEPQLLKEITHDNILKIIDARILESDIAYYLTPEISGGDLQNIIDTYIVSINIGINIVQGILKGLNELHKSPRNLVHRDLKTGNVLVEKENGKAYLADFGTVKKIPDNTDRVSASKFTFLYKPYEVVIDNAYLKQSDLYQVGIVLYQTLGGFFPMKNIEDWLKSRAKAKYNQLIPVEQQVFMKNYLEDLIVKGKIINCDTLPQYTNRKLKTIIRTATHTDYTKRYQTCAEFLKALFEYQKDCKDWWKEGDTIHAFCKKKKRTYRIVARKNETVVETSQDKITWRKKIGDTKLKTLIDYIEND